MRLPPEAKMPQKRGHVKRPRRAVKIWQIMERCQNNKCCLGPGTRISLWGAMEWHKTSTFLVWVLAVNTSPWGSILPNFPPWGTQLRASLCGRLPFHQFLPELLALTMRWFAWTTDVWWGSKQKWFSQLCVLVGKEGRSAKIPGTFQLFYCLREPKAKGYVLWTLTLSLWLSVLLPEIPTTERIHL